MSLFSSLPRPEKPVDHSQPLAERMRPRTLDEVVGQEHLLAPGKPLRLQIERDDPGSIIFWGPPGVGKTTLAQIIARVTKAEFMEFSAVLSGIKEIKQVMADAEKAKQFGTRTIVLVEEQIITLMKRALADTERGLAQLNVTASDEILARIAAFVSGDARSAYNILEIASNTARQNAEKAGLKSGTTVEITEPVLLDVMQRKVLLYDKAGEEHYNLISALHKSVRNSDVDASLYWAGRMLASGEDPLYVARRVVRMAVEDIGLADPNALSICIAARDAYEFLGTPEGELAIAQAVAYLALAPKSNALC